jgi:hypothetical protein
MTLSNSEPPGSGQANLMILLFISQIHTTVTRTKLLLQYNSGWAFCATMRWPRFTSRIVGLWCFGYLFSTAHRFLIVNSAVMDANLFRVHDICSVR